MYNLNIIIGLYTDLVSIFNKLLMKYPIVNFHLEILASIFIQLSDLFSF